MALAGEADQYLVACRLHLRPLFVCLILGTARAARQCSLLGKAQSACCRCVVVMGMPFPNPADPELCERMRFLDAAVSKSAKQPQSDEQSRKASSCRFLTCKACA